MLLAEDGSQLLAEDGSPLYIEFGDPVAATWTLLTQDGSPLTVQDGPGLLLEGPFVARPPSGLLIAQDASWLVTEAGEPLAIEGSAGVWASTLREAVFARLSRSPWIAAVVGPRIFFGALPQTKRFPALTYFVPSRTGGHNLGGADGTSRARVQISAWSFSELEAEQLAMAIRDRFDGFVGLIGQVEITACLFAGEVDLPEPPGKDGSDDWTYQIAVDYSISHRVPLPTLLRS